jgi:hypothetical protein
VIAGIALSDASLADAVDRLIASMRAHGVELDPTGVVGLSTLLRVGQEQLDNALETHPQADVGVQFIPTGSTGGVLEFWLQSAGRKGSSARKYNGSVGEIQALGFDVEIDPGSQKIAAIGLGAAWLKEHNFGMLGRVDAVFLLRTAEPSKP